MDYRQRWEHKEYVSGQRLDRRIQLFHVAVAMLLVIFILDFWHLQVVRGDEFRELSENNRLRRIWLEPSRGVILDRAGRVLASTRPSLDLVMVREDGRDPEQQLRRLAQVLEEPHDSLAERWRRMGGRPLYEPLVLREDVQLEELAWIEARRELFPSVEVREHARRSYPNGRHAAHALGYVGQISERELASRAEGDFRSGDIIGKTGLERIYDDMLRGKRGHQFVSVNTLGRTFGPSRLGLRPRDGNPLKLTIDLDLQRVLVEALADEAGAGVFIDSRTGEVLALASSPPFDPNDFADGISREQWQAIQQDPRRPLHDRVTDAFYAPGSTFKVVLAVAGLETGTVNLSKTVYCKGWTTFYGRRRLCWKRGGHGTVNLLNALAHSCNVYFYELGRDLGIGRIHTYGEKFGLGQPTGIDLPGERSGILPSEAWKRKARNEIWYPGDTISVAIGQGYLAVTPLQMATMIAAVANDGLRVTPFLRAGHAQEPQPTGVRLETLEIIRPALAEAVRSGTARAARIEGFAAAGKTGTAQVYKHSAGIDADELPKAERDHAWFVGYAPVEAPTIAFAVVVEHGGHGGTTAAPIARKVLEAYRAGRLAEDGLRAAASGGGDVRPPAAR